MLGPPFKPRGNPSICSLTRLCLEGFLLGKLKGAGQWNPPRAVPPVAPPGCQAKAKAKAKANARFPQLRPLGAKQKQKQRQKQRQKRRQKQKQSKAPSKSKSKGKSKGKGKGKKQNVNMVILRTLSGGVCSGATLSNSLQSFEFSRARCRDLFTAPFSPRRAAGHTRPFSHCRWRHCTRW